MSVSLLVNGDPVEVQDETASLLAVLREQLGLRAAKDGCSPQGQCGCCTVLVDGSPRVSCVTPVRRVAGRSITTLEGIAPGVQEAWAEAFCATGASQCGFCTPGIIVRLEAHRIATVPGATADAPASSVAPGSAHDEVAGALAAHLCRCTGWNTIVEAYELLAEAADLASAERVASSAEPDADPGPDLAAGPSFGGVDVRSVWRVRGGADLDDRDLEAASARASIETGGFQTVSPAVALGRGGFADDLAPPGALVAVPDAVGGWAVGETLAAARLAAGKVQGRRTTVDPAPPLALPAGDWALTLQTSWVDPAYLETDASWCEPGGEPVTPLANGGAFGAKLDSPVGAAARRLADELGRPVRVLLSREDTVRLGAKRPPMAVGLRADGTGIARVVRTEGIAAAITATAPWLEVEEVDRPGPPTSSAVRGAGWVEGAVLLAALDERGADARTRVARIAEPRRLRAPNGAWATAVVADDGAISVQVACGDPLDETVLRSYCIGAAHMALSWVTSEGLVVDPDGTVHDLTVRSFGILRAAAMPPVHVTIVADDDITAPVNGSDAVFAAVAAATWIRHDCPPVWPTGPLPTTFPEPTEPETP